MSELREQIVNRIKQATYGNAVLANNLYRILEEYCMNGISATDIEDKIDWDSILDPTLGYYENKSNLLAYLKNQGYFSEREMITDDSMRRREEDRLVNSSEKQQREEAALVESEETKARFSQALKTIAQDKPLEDLLCEVLPEINQLNIFLDTTLEGTYTSGGIVSGDPGIAKTHRVLSTLQKRGTKFELYNAHASSLSLFEILYLNKDDVVVFDDLESIMDDPRSIGILKAASFSATGLREVCWNSTTKILAEKGLPQRFVFSGKILIITNNEYKSRNASFQALISRLPIFRLNFTLDSRKILVRSIVLKQPMFGLSDEVKKNVLEFMEEMLDYSKADNFNLRTVIRAMEIYKLKGEAGKPLIVDLLGIDSKMRKYLLIEDKAQHLSVGKRVDVWKMATGFSVQSYYNTKNRHMKDRFSEDQILGKELEDIENAIEEVGRTV
jgi:hypothetical protein